ncbi:hypothetical protein WJX79_007913 [Trebouxia sp. C0005]
MASQNLKSFLSSVNSGYLHYADAIYDSEFTSQAELGAADRADLQALGIPKGAAGLIIAAARGAGRQISLLYISPPSKHGKLEAGEELTWMASVDDQEKQSSKSWLRHAVESALIALDRPAGFLVPVGAAVVSIKAVSSFLDALLVHQTENAFLGKWATKLAYRTLTTLAAAEFVVYEVSQVAIIAFGVWTALRFKDRMVKVIMDVSALKDQKKGIVLQSTDNTMERVVLPFSGLASWVLILGGCLATLQVLGINIQPLLTVGGVSGIVVGLSAQSVMSNMISGINLFISRPFVVGDRIEISSVGGSKFVVGTVERVDPMRTIIRTDSCMPITIPNKVLSEQIISNESRIARTKVIVNFNKPRQMQFTFLVRYEDFSKVEAICTDMKDHLLNTEGIHRQLPMWVGFTGVEGNACNVYTILHTTPAMSRDFGGFRQGLFFKLEQIIASHGAKLAYPTHVNILPQMGKTIGDGNSKSNGSNGASAMPSLQAR